MRMVKVVALGAVAALAVGVLCGCAPVFGRVGQIFHSIREEVRDEARQEGEKFRDRQGESAAEEFGAMMELVYGDGKKDGDYLLEYEPYGVSYDEVSEVGWFNGKPLAGMYDAGYNTVTSGAYADIGAFVIVDRDEAGNVVGVYETDKETYQRLSGIDGIGSPKQAAEENGFSFCKEDKNIKGLDQAAFTKLENELRMKYKNENVHVECNDYVFSFYKGDLLTISSTCATDRNSVTAKAYVDYNSTPDGFDINIFDSGKTDEIIMKILNENGGEEDEIDQALTEAIAQAYGVDEKYILIELGR